MLKVTSSRFPSPDQNSKPVRLAYVGVLPVNQASPLPSPIKSGSLAASVQRHTPSSFYLEFHFRYMAPTFGVIFIGHQQLRFIKLYTLPDRLCIRATTLFRLLTDRAAEQTDAACNLSDNVGGHKMKTNKSHNIGNFNRLPISLAINGTA